MFVGVGNPRNKGFKANKYLKYLLLFR